MQPGGIDRILNKAVAQIDFVNPDVPWMMSDLKNMRIRFRSRGANMDDVLKNKMQMIRQVWKLGKAHELMSKGLLHSDGSLSKEAFDYLENQKQGKIPSGLLPGDIYIELALFKNKK